MIRLKHTALTGSTEADTFAITVCLIADSLAFRLSKRFTAPATKLSDTLLSALISEKHFQ